MEILNKLLETGNYDDSPIAQAYQRVLENYERLYFMYQKYSLMGLSEIVFISSFNSRGLNSSIFGVYTSLIFLYHHFF